MEHEKPLPWWRHLWLAYRMPFSLLLTFLALVSYVTEDMKATIVISAMVALSTLIRFWQETKSNKAAEKLKAMVYTTATAVRRGISEDAAPVFKRYFGVEIHTKPARRLEIPIRELVPGDIVLLSAGDMIPAACRVLSAKDLFVSQAAMTGESLPTEKFSAIQNFGAMDVLCTDKTGTLTQDKIVLERHTDVRGDDADDVLEYAYLNSYYQTGLKNLLDVAVLTHAEVHRELEVATAFRKVDEVPFEFQRRRMSVVVAEHDEHHLLICKGAVDEILGVCSHARHGGVEEPLTAELLASARDVTAALNEEGLRVVAVAVKEMPPTKDTYGVRDESGLTLVGYVTFLDPPKESAAPALKALAEHGVRVKVLTGDNELVTSKICRQVGLAHSDALLGSEVEQMSDAELMRAADTYDIFARLTQTLIVHTIQTQKIPFLQSRAAPILLAATGVIMAIGVFLPMGRVADYFKMQALPLAYFPFLIVILFGYMTLTQWMKGFYRAPLRLAMRISTWITQDLGAGGFPHSA